MQNLKKYAIQLLTFNSLVCPKMNHAKTYRMVSNHFGDLVLRVWSVIRDGR